MRLVVINTGTELLLGDVLNTHLVFIARELFPLGLRIERQVTVPDGPAIRTALLETFPQVDCIFLTGGLGPTTDDLTRDFAAELLGLPLRRDPAVLAAITERLAARGIPMLDRIARQADVPAGAEVLPNENGTAPGLYLPANLNGAMPSPHLFLLPGPPRELQPMFRASVLPKLRELAPRDRPLESRLFRVVGMGESVVESLVGEEILALPGVELGYCARPGEVDVRIVGEPAALAPAEAIIVGKLAGSIFTRGHEHLEEVLVKTLAVRGETLATAESCTGGYLAHRITNMPGASAVFLAGYVTYANGAKTDTLGIDDALLREHGAVSAPVARAMAEGARARAGATHALATTGIAGPAGGTADKPVGTVFMSLASVGAATRTERFCYPAERETFKQLVAQAAFNLLRQRLG